MLLPVEKLNKNKAEKAVSHKGSAIIDRIELDRSFKWTFASEKSQNELTLNTLCIELDQDLKIMFSIRKLNSLTKKRSQIQYCVTNWSLKTGYIYWTIFFIINQVVSWWCTLVVRKIAHFLLCNQFTQWGKKRLWNRNRIWIWILYHFYCNVLKSSSFFDKTYEFVKATKIYDKIFQWIWSLQKQTNGVRLSQNIWTLMNCTIWINFVQNIP